MAMTWVKIPSLTFQFGIHVDPFSFWVWIRAWPLIESILAIFDPSNGPKTD